VTIQLPPIDDDVYAALQALAVPLEDDINTVLRRLLHLGSDHDAGRESAQVSQSVRDDSPHRPRRRSAKPRKAAKKRTRVPKGSILPESEYELPILRALAQLGGRAPTSEVISQIESEIDPKLTEADREKLSSGDVRWKNRAQFARLKLINKGDMAAGSPRGIWEISAAGQKRVKDGG